MKGQYFYSEQDYQSVKRRMFKIQVIDGQDFPNDDNIPYMSKFPPKPLPKSISGKRSQSINPSRSRPRKEGISPDEMCLSGIKLKGQVPQESKTLESQPDDIQPDKAKKKNLKPLVKPVKLTTEMLLKNKISSHIFKNSKKQEFREWNNLPQEFKKIPLFQAIYLNKNSEVLNPEINPSLKPQGSGALKSWRPSGQKEIKRVYNSNEKEQNMDYESKYYGIETIRYQNYKYQKVANQSSLEKLAARSRINENKVSLEFCLQDTQKKRKNLRDIEDLHSSPRQGSKKLNPKRQMSIPESIYSQSQVSLLNYTERENKNKNDQASPYELDTNNNTLEKSETNLNKRQSLPSLPSGFRGIIGRSESPISNRSPVEDKKAFLLAEKKKSSPRNKKPTAEKTLNGSKDMKKWKAEFEEMFVISQKWLEEVKTIASVNDFEREGYREYFQASKEPGICLKVFLDHQDILKKQKKFIVDRILLALGLNPANKKSIINLETFSKFKRTLVTKEAPLPELVDFVIQVLKSLINVLSFKFFKIEENEELSKENFTLIMKSLGGKNEGQGRTAKEEDSPCEALIENYKLLEVIREDREFVDFDKFREVHLSDKMNILDLIDLIMIVN